jgi:ubiquinone/menaquinone biosynthesis C-methylase UbiE
MREYDLIAEWYASSRSDHTGVPEVRALAQAIPPGGRVLDLGCGNGEPLAVTLRSLGFRVIGLDSSSQMLSRFASACPTTPAVRALAQACPFRDRTFDAAIAWGVMFHLSQPEQVETLSSVSRVLKAGAPFLFTSGDVDGRDRHVGTMNGVEFPYYSFSLDGYQRVLRENGLKLVAFHVDEGENGYYFARKQA